MSHQETSHMFMNAWDADSRPPRGQAQFLSHLCKLQASVHEGKEEEVVTSTTDAGEKEEENFAKQFRGTLLCVFFSYPKIIILVFSQLERSREKMLQLLPWS